MALYLNDVTSNANNLTNVNAVSEVTTSLPFGASTIAADFEASSSQYFYAEDSSSLSITGDLTIECWVKFESLPSAARSTFVAKWEHIASNKRSYEFYLIDDSGTLKLQFLYSPDGNFDGANIGSVNWTPSTATWYHIAVTFLASTAKINFYVDGSLQGTEQTGSATSIYNSDRRLSIGAEDIQNTPAQFFDGIMDDVRIWNDVRTPTEISNNRSVELAGNESNLVAYWPFEVPSSPSASPSMSPSSSSSSSTSRSESPSISPSSSASSSVSASASSSASFSASASESSSASRSHSPSSSTSPSPSIGYSNYSRGNYLVLPTNDNDLETIYTEVEETAVSVSDDNRVGQTGANEYMVHQFKTFVGSRTFCEINLECRSARAPSASTVYLQIYDQGGGAWETLDSNSLSRDALDFTFVKYIPDLTNYKTAANTISVRVYQLAS